MKIAIIGAGHAGCAQAAQLVRNGHRVHLIKTSKSMHEENFDMIEKQGGIYMTDLDDPTPWFAKFDMITRDIEKGLSGDIDVIMVLTQSSQHPDVAKRIAPYFKTGQIVLVIPGYMGSLYFKNETKVDGVIFAEGESVPNDARITSPGNVYILFRNMRNSIAFLDSKNNKYLTTIGQLFRKYECVRTNIIESGMHNPNMIVHTVGALLMASRVEDPAQNFWMYMEAFSDSIWKIIGDLDTEKNQVIVAYGGESLAYLDACKWRNEEDLNVDSLEVFRGYAPKTPMGPNTLDTRYITEDVPQGLCLLESLAQKANIKTPITTALIEIASSLMSVDYRTCGRTLEKLGLANLSVEQIKTLL